MEETLFTDLVDLHTHLGASSTPDLLWRLGHAQGIRLPSKDYWDFMEMVTINDKTTAEEYHNIFEITQTIQSSPQAVEQAVYEAVSLSYRKANITLQEIRVNPMRRNNQGLYDLDRIIFSAIIGLKRAMIEYPIKAGLILETDRRFTPEQNLIILDKAVKFAGEGVHGVDLSGPGTDNEFSFKDVASGFEAAHKAGLGVTVHTGEDTDLDEMREVLDLIKPHRIGHGIAAAKDEKMMDELVERGIVLEVCPTSNVKIGIVKDLDEIRHILNTFKKKGVKFTINADAPVFLRTNVQDELLMLYKEKILTEKDVIDVISTAREASFIHKNPIGLE